MAVTYRPKASEATQAATSLIRARSLLERMAIPTSDSDSRDMDEAKSMIDAAVSLLQGRKGEHA